MRKHILKVTIKDCRVDTFRAGGNGGQNQNVRDTGVRVVHEPSGAVGESREERKQLQNKRKAFMRMAQSQKFQTWAEIMGAELRSPEEIVEEKMKPENLKVEVRENGKWTEQNHS